MSKHQTKAPGVVARGVIETDAGYHAIVNFEFTGVATLYFGGPEGYRDKRHAMRVAGAQSYLEAETNARLGGLQALWHGPTTLTITSEAELLRPDVYKTTKSVIQEGEHQFVVHTSGIGRWDFGDGNLPETVASLRKFVLEDVRESINNHFDGKIKRKDLKITATIYYTDSERGNS